MGFPVKPGMTKNEKPPCLFRELLCHSRGVGNLVNTNSYFISEWIPTYVGMTNSCHSGELPCLFRELLSHSRGVGNLVNTNSYFISEWIPSQAGNDNDGAGFPVELGITEKWK